MYNGSFSKGAISWGICGGTLIALPHSATIHEHCLHHHEHVDGSATRKQQLLEYMMRTCILLHFFVPLLWQSCWWHPVQTVLAYLLTLWHCPNDNTIRDHGHWGIGAVALELSEELHHQTQLIFRNGSSTDGHNHPALALSSLIRSTRHRL